MWPAAGTTARCACSTSRPAPCCTRLKVRPVASSTCPRVAVRPSRTATAAYFLLLLTCSCTPAHAMPVRSVKFGPGAGTVLYSASDDGRIDVHDTCVQAGACVGILPGLAPRLAAARVLTLPWPSAVCRSSPAPNSASLVQSLAGHVSWVLCVDPSPDGLTIATGCVFSPLHRVPAGPWCEGRGSRTGPSWPNVCYGRSSDKQVKIWDMRRRECVHTFDSHTDQVRVSVGRPQRGPPVVLDCMPPRPAC